MTALFRRALCAMTILLAAPQSALAADVTLTVGAASSLQDVLQKLAPEFEKANPGTRVAFNFAASSAIARQLEKGAPMDVFFSADGATMDGLSKSGIIDTKTRKDVVGNELVVIVPAAAGAPKAFTPRDLTGSAYRKIALCDPSVPVGHYGELLLAREGLKGELDGKLVRPENVRAALAVVASGAADAGFVYATDVAVGGAKVAVAYRAGSAVDVRHPVAVVGASKNGAAAAKLVAYLTSPEALAVFVAAGFKKLGAPS